MADTPNVYASLTGEFGAQRDAAAALTGMFQDMGLGDLSAPIIDWLKNGFSADAIQYMIQQHPVYKARFSANDARLKAGLPALSPAEYLATEKAYRQIMSAAGVPAGFYDSPDDFKAFLEKDISPSEVQGRVTAAKDFINRMDPQAVAQFKQWYTTGDMIAYALDPTRAVDLVGRSFTAAEAGGAASRNGATIGKTLAEQIAGTGVTSDQIDQGFGAIGQDRVNAEKLGSIYGDKLTDEDLAREAFLADSNVANRRSKLASQERAAFGGTSGIGSGSLGRSTAGQL